MDDSQQFHINFVSNHNGSTPSDIFISTLPAPFSVALTSVVIPFLLPSRYALLRYSSRIWIHLLIETITVVCPLLLSFTLLSDGGSMNLVFLLLFITGLMIFAPNWWNTKIPPLDHLLALPLQETKPPFLTNYRAGMNFATAICILAVDFQVFPRRFAKTETYGFSLMDVGVGSFVLANGLVGSSPNTGVRLSKVWSKTLPILILGFARLAAVKLSNYHEHVTEYGVHWNFFFTLAIVKGASALIKLPYRPILISLGILVVYEFCLNLGLESWILSDYPRNNIISANREGIFSLFGYLSLYYAALELGNYMKKSRNSFKDWFRLLVVLVALSLFGWMALKTSETVFGRPSRRLANASFCIWMFTYNMAVMSSYLLVDLLLVAFDVRRDSAIEKESNLPVFREPYLLRFINYNGLTFFLLANVFTGLVNKTFSTVSMDPLASMVLLFGYCCLLCFSVAGLYLWRFRI